MVQEDYTKFKKTSRADLDNNKNCNAIFNGKLKVESVERISALAEILILRFSFSTFH